MEATEPPLLFLTNTAYINKLINRKRIGEGKEPHPFVPVFRHALAKDKPYKAGRASVKPFHYKNLIAHILFEYPFYVNTHGLEADDAMCCFQTHASPLSTIICSRDKDLRQCSGWYYSWECGKQLAIGPILVKGLGHVEIKNQKEREKAKAEGMPLPTAKGFGYGTKWFYYQMICGDTVDNIGGLKNGGTVTAVALLDKCKSEWECYEVVRDRFSKTGEGWEERMREAADLTYMIRDFDFETKEYKRWTPPSCNEELIKQISLKRKEAMERLKGT